MRSSVALIAEHTSVSRDGRLTVVDTYNVRDAQIFPAEIRGINLAIGLIFEPADWGKPVSIVIRIVDPDGKELVRLTGEPPLTFTPARPGFPAAWFNALSVNVVFPHEGTYVFQLRVNDEELAEMPLYVGPIVPRAPTNPGSSS